MLIEKVILVDEQDNAIGFAEKLQAHQQGWLHRAFSIFIYRYKNNQWELLLQQRHPDKYHCGGLWTNTCCSHPRPGENILTAAKRRLKEEMNLSVALQAVGSFTYKALVGHLTEYEYDHILTGLYQNEAINAHPAEIMDYKWIGLPALMEDLKTNLSLYTPWFKQALAIALPS